MQVAVHAIGDRAIDATLHAYAQAQQHQPGNCHPQPHRVEHAEHFSGPGTIAQFRQLGVYAMGNPIHITYDRENIRKELGAERSGPGKTYAYRSLLEVGPDRQLACKLPCIGLWHATAAWWILLSCVSICCTYLLLHSVQDLVSAAAHVIYLGFDSKFAYVYDKQCATHFHGCY